MIVPFNFLFSKRKTSEDRRHDGKHGNNIELDGGSETETDLDSESRDYVESHGSMGSDTSNVKPHEDVADHEAKKNDGCSIKKDDGDEVGNNDKTDAFYIKTEDDGDECKVDRTAEINIKGEELNVREEEDSEDGNDCKYKRAHQNHMDNKDGRDLSNSHKKIFKLSQRNSRTAQNNRHPVAETRSPGTKNRSRQRPTRNTAMEESAIVPDSEDGGCSLEATNAETPTADMEEDSD